MLEYSADIDTQGQGGISMEELMEFNNQQLR